MSLQVLTDSAEIKRALNLFRAGMMGDGEPMKRFIGWQGGGRDFSVYWSRHLKMWTTFFLSENKTRYVSFFGFGDPHEHKTLTITCEINHPRSGYDRRVAGMFLLDRDGKVYLGHSGKIGGGKPGVGKSNFLAAYGADQLEPVAWPSGRQTEALILGRVGSPDLAGHVRDFVAQVREFKTGSRRSKKTVSNARPKFLLTPEFEGRKARYRFADTIEARCFHGRVVNTLMAILKKRFHFVHRDRSRDLFVMNAKQTLTHLFEAKTDISTTSIYGALGQLLLHGAAVFPPPKRILVLPERPKKSVREALSSLGVKVLRFRLKHGTATFDNLKRALR